MKIVLKWLRLNYLMVKHKGRLSLKEPQRKVLGSATGEEMGLGCVLMPRENR